MVRGSLLRTLLTNTTTKTTKSYFNRRIFPTFRPFSAASAVVENSNPSLDPSRLRNVAVIAHVDHGKTTLMDRLLRQCGADIPHERAMDSISLERERGITISSKVCILAYFPFLFFYFHVSRMNCYGEVYEEI